MRDSGIAREEIFLTTKIGAGNLGAAEARRSAEESLGGSALIRSICC